MGQDLYPIQTVSVVAYQILSLINLSMSKLIVLLLLNMQGVCSVSTAWISHYASCTRFLNACQ